MQIWWGWRLAFDCTCLWGFLYYFSLCKSNNKAVDTFSHKAVFLAQPKFSAVSCEWIANMVPFRSDCFLEVQENGACEMDSATQTVHQQPLLLDALALEK